MTTRETVVDRLYGEFQAITERLGTSEISLRNSAEETFRKALLLAAASHFEQEVKGQVLRLTGKHSGDTEVIVEFVRNKAVERQYHTYFNWSARNANSFFGLFGQGFRSFMSEHIRADNEYDVAIRAFLEIGNERNRLVHEDFGSYSLEKTSEEIFSLYRTASAFVESIELRFDEYIQSLT